MPFNIQISFFKDFTHSVFMWSEKKSNGLCLMMKEYKVVLEIKTCSHHSSTASNQRTSQYLKSIQCKGDNSRFQMLSCMNDFYVFSKFFR